MLHYRYSLSILALPEDVTEVRPRTADILCLPTFGISSAKLPAFWDSGKIAVPLLRPLILFVLLLLYGLPTLADKTLVVPEDAVPVQLYPGCKTITVLLKPGKAKIDLKEKPRVTGLVFSGVTKDIQGFAAKWIGKKRAEAVEITLDLPVIARSGTYDLYLDLQPESNPIAERLHLQIVHPEPKMSPVPKLLIDRTRYLPWWDSTTQPRLTLVESSNLSALTKIDFNQNTNTVLGPKLIGGTLHVTDAKKQINAGTSADFSYEVVNDFPLGSATGTLTVRAAEMNAPAGTVDFEVHTHLHPLYIGVTIFVGLVLSYFLKVHLQQNIELDQAKLDARKLLEELVAEERKHEDPEFRRGYEEAKGSIETALEGDNAKDINTKKMALDTAWRDALQKLAVRRQTLEANFAKITDILSVPWLVPKSIREAIERAKASLSPVQMSLNSDNLPNAKLQLNDLLGVLANDIREGAIAWQNSLKGIFDNLLTGPPGISKPIGERLRKPIDDVRPLIGTITPDTDLSTSEQIQEALLHLRIARTAVTQFLDWLRLAISSEVSNIATEAKSLAPGKWNASAFDVIPKADQALATILFNTADAPNWSKLSAALRALHDGWTQALEKQLSPRPCDLDELLKAQDYTTASAAVLHALQSADQLLGETEAVATLSTRFPTFAHSLVIPAMSPSYSLRTQFQTLFTAAPAKATAVTEARKLWRDKLWQTLAIGIVVTLIGYTTQLDTFVGTFTEISTLFFWAFGLDLTLDTVRSLAPKKSA